MAREGALYAHIFTAYKEPPTKPDNIFTGGEFRIVGEELEVTSKNVDAVFALECENGKKYFVKRVAIDESGAKDDVRMDVVNGLLLSRITEFYDGDEGESLFLRYKGFMWYAGEGVETLALVNGMMDPAEYIPVSLLDKKGIKVNPAHVSLLLSQLERMGSDYGIYHHDMHGGNLYYNKDNTKYPFMIIDYGRVCFLQLERLDSLIGDDTTFYDQLGKMKTGAFDAMFEKQLKRWAGLNKKIYVADIITAFISIHRNNNSPLLVQGLLVNEDGIGIDVSNDSPNSFSGSAAVLYLKMFVIYCVRNLKFHVDVRLTKERCFLYFGVLNLQKLFNCVLHWDDKDFAGWMEHNGHFDTIEDSNIAHIGDMVRKSYSLAYTTYENKADNVYKRWRRTATVDIKKLFDERQYAAASSDDSQSTASPSPVPQQIGNFPAAAPVREKQNGVQPGNFKIGVPPGNNIGVPPKLAASIKTVMQEDVKYLYKFEDDKDKVVKAKELGSAAGSIMKRISELFARKKVNHGGRFSGGDGQRPPEHGLEKPYGEYHGSDKEYGKVSEIDLDKVIDEAYESTREMADEDSYWPPKYIRLCVKQAVDELGLIDIDAAAKLCDDLEMLVHNDVCSRLGPGPGPERSFGDAATTAEPGQSGGDGSRGPAFAKKAIAVTVSLLCVLFAFV